MKSNSSCTKASLLQPKRVLFREYSTTTGLLQQKEKLTQIQNSSVSRNKQAVTATSNIAKELNKIKKSKLTAISLNN